MSKKWDSNDMGWGWTLRLANGLDCSVYKSQTRGEHFKWSVFGLSGKKQYEDEKEAKAVAEKNARILLETALFNLGAE